MSNRFAIQQHERSKCVALVLVYCFNTLSMYNRARRREMQIQYDNRFAYAATHQYNQHDALPLVLCRFIKT
jgi:hypothetical protein